MKTSVQIASILVMFGLIGGIFKWRIDHSKLIRSSRVKINTIQIGDLVQSNITVISIYFKLNETKYIFDKYARWQRYFFRSISNVPIVVYTDKTSLSSLIEMSLHTSNPKTFYVFDNIWSIVSLIEQDRLKRPGDYINNYKQVQQKLDPEGQIHNPELYAIWNCKSFFLKHSSRSKQNVYGSKFFIYSDIGAFRGRYFPK